jgi:hypothetical protein
MSIRGLDLPPEFALFQVCKLKLSRGLFNFSVFIYFPMTATPISPSHTLRVTEGKVNLHSQIPTSVKISPCSDLTGSCADIIARVFRVRSQGT